MAKLIYSAIASLDGYVVDDKGKFDWAAPSEEVHAFVNDLESRVRTYLYGRRLYEVMVAWETQPVEGDAPKVMLDYAKIWHAAEKVVYSKTLKNVSSRKTRIAHELDAGEVRRMKAAAALDIGVGGRRSRGRRSRRGWWTRYISSSTRCSWVAARERFRTACASISS